LVRLPGIGKKTAERIIIELRDKLDGLPAATAPVPGGGAAAPANATAEAITALNALGYKPQESSSLVRRVAKPDMDVEEIIRLALQSTVKPG
jgi:Holliday junction DNA helicase RuvA